MINGDKVELNDNVWVLGRGNGIVIAVGADGSFRVRLGNDIAEFSAGGMLGKTRRVYWHNPILFDPPKHGSMWRRFVVMAEAIYAQWRQAFTNGEVNDGANET